VFALGGLVHGLVVNPAPAVAGDLVAQFLEGGGQVRVAFQRHAHAKHGERQAALLEFAQDAPHARTRTVFVNAFHADVAFGVAGRVEHFRQELLRAGVAVQHAVFAAFLIVQHELHAMQAPLGHNAWVRLCHNRLGRAGRLVESACFMVWGEWVPI
jgi:hypothetical protein